MHALPHAPAPTLEFQDVACARGDRLLFRGVSLRLEPGQMLRVSGANGCGKSSLLRIACGLLSPAHGEVRWRGRALRGHPAQAADMLYLGHSHALREELSPRENLRHAASLLGERPSDAALSQALALANANGFADLPVRRLSQGQRRRSALARLALARRQPLWILDEPFNALDTQGTGWLMEELHGHSRRGGLLVFTSHQPLPIDALAHQELAL